MSSYRKKARAKGSRSHHQGEAGEIIADDMSIVRLEESKRTGVGSDRLRIQRNVDGSVHNWYLEEDKTGKARQTSKQRETQQKVGDAHYKVRRINGPLVEIVADGLQMRDSYVQAWGVKKRRH